MEARARKKLHAHSSNLFEINFKATRLRGSQLKAYNIPLPETFLLDLNFLESANQYDSQSAK